MNKKLKLLMCIDRFIPIQQKTLAATLAVEENPLNQPRLPRLLAGASMHPAKMALLTGKKWENGRELSVYFMGGSATQGQGAPVCRTVGALCEYQLQLQHQPIQRSNSRLVRAG